MIYKIEIQLFREDGTYNAYLLCRKKSDCNDEWRICACYTASALESVFEWEEEWMKIYGE